MKDEFLSVFATRMDGMISFKVALGYSRKSYAGFLVDFDRFCTKEFPAEHILTKELFMKWAIMRPTEKPTGFRRRVGVLREFGKYLAMMDEMAYVMPSNMVPLHSSFTPYILTDDELVGVFDAADAFKFNPLTPNRHHILRVLLRIIYYCGLRPNEGRTLKCSGLDFETGQIMICETKCRKDRIVMMSNDVLELCKRYKHKLDIFCPNSEYLFPSANGQPYPAKWLTRQFHMAWILAYPERSVASLPRVYDLRHRFASAVMMMWLDDGKDLYSMLPYLSAYMGHAHFSATAYYIHLLPANLTKSASIDWEKFSNLIPEVALWEE